jgi:4-diphosphocytidyl-2-C-methyl-D-erythritol kinase
MICFPNAKINLGLRVIEKRRDGYHNIETVFYPLTLSDIIEITPLSDNPGRYAFRNTGEKVGVDPSENLCIKALNELNKHRHIPPVSIHLHKIIPSGSGLGGGSSDAAFVLKTLNDLFHLQLSLPELASIAGRIGSDCPFFIHNKPLLAQGRGEIFKPVEIDLTGIHILLVHPGISVSSGWAYSHVKPGKQSGSVSAILRTDPGDWQGKLFNDFEPGIFNAYPQIESIRNKMLSAGAFYASMTGSGSAVYGLFNKPAEPGMITEEFSGMFVWKGVLT